MGNLDIYFFFISILFIIWTCQVHEWEDISKPANIHNIIMLFTVLHIVAKQPMKIAKKATSMLILVVDMVKRNEFLILILMLLQDNIFFYILTIKKLFASLSFIAKQYKMQNF